MITDRNVEEIYSEVLNACFEVHKKLGPGLLESAYAKCLSHELQIRGLKVETERMMPLVYKEIKMDCGYRLDMLVEERVIIELKAIDQLSDLHMAQILTYMKLSDLKLGLLINFNTKLLKTGIKRVIL